MSVCGTGNLIINCINFLELAIADPLGRSLKVPSVPYNTLDEDVHHLASIHSSVNMQLKHYQAGTGLLTRCASTTPYGLALAPGLP